MATNEPGSTRTTAAAVSRRRFLFLVGGALNVVAATLLAIPLIGYVFSRLFSQGTLWVVDHARCTGKFS